MSCEECKHSRWWGDYAMDICEKHHKTNMLEKCVDYEPKVKQKRPPTCKKTAHDKLPAWCKVGAWVVAKFDLEANKRVKDCVLKRIDEVDAFGGITAKTLKGEREYDGWSAYLPIRFRPYTYEEAKRLIGKVMEISHDGFLETGIITRVRLVYRAHPDGFVTINGTHFEWLAKCYNATIDGLPIGVPVVADDVMKGGEE